MKFNIVDVKNNKVLDTASNKGEADRKAVDLMKQGKKVWIKMGGKTI